MDIRSQDPSSHRRPEAGAVDRALFGDHNETAMDVPESADAAWLGVRIGNHNETVVVLEASRVRARRGR